MYHVSYEKPLTIHFQTTICKARKPDCDVTHVSEWSKLGRKTSVSLTAHWMAQISVSLSLSQTPAKAARPWI